MIRLGLLLAMVACPTAAQACFASPQDPAVDFRVTTDRGALEAFNVGGKGSAFCVLKLDCSVRPSATGIVFSIRPGKSNSLDNVFAIQFRYADNSVQPCGVVAATIAFPPAPLYPEVDPKLKGFSAPKKPEPRP